MAKLSKDSVKQVHAVVGVICRDEHLLVCERPVGKPYAGFWEFPGGKIEATESGLDALRRELHEELGIEVQAADFLFQHQHDYPDKHVLLDLWRVNAFTGEPTNREKQRLRWATIEEIKQLPLLEGNWAILERVAQIISQSLQTIP